MSYETRVPTAEPVPSVVLLPFPQMAPGARLVLSFGKRVCDGDLYAEPRVSFAWVGEHVAAEWSPPYGPIQMWYRVPASDTDTPARPHWLFPRVAAHRMGAWAQGAVLEEGLAEAACAGDYAQVFAVLRRWARSDEADADEVTP